MHKENDGLIKLALFGERELIKLLGILGVKAKCLRIYLQDSGGMAWHDGYLTTSLKIIIQFYNLILKKKIFT